jgi:hypothetical protein
MRRARLHAATAAFAPPLEEEAHAEKARLAKFWATAREIVDFPVPAIPFSQNMYSPFGSSVYRAVRQGGRPECLDSI